MSSDRSVGIQACDLGGSFHEIAANTYGFQSDQLVPFSTHADLLHALKSNEVDTAVCAIDNTQSGRVVSAIDRLARGALRNLQIVGVVDIEVPQAALRHPDTPEYTIRQALSQLPALDQCEDNLNTLGYTRVETTDTLLAARIVAENKGIVNGIPTIAIASAMAGRTHRLINDGILSDNPHSQTRFWILKKLEKANMSGNHASFVFDVPDIKEGLLRAVDILTNEGYNFTDFDSHLTPNNSGNRRFYAEVECGGNDIEGDLRSLGRRGYKSTILGRYDSAGTLTVASANGSVPPAINHGLWRHTRGLAVPDDSEVIYVAAKNRPGSLRGMLQSLRIVNLIDMSRPVAGHNGDRGFYFVIDPKTPRSLVDNSAARLSDLGYRIQRLNHVAGKLT